MPEPLSVHILKLVMLMSWQGLPEGQATFIGPRVRPAAAVPVQFCQGSVLAVGKGGMERIGETYVELYVLVEDAVTGDGVHARPVCVEVEGVGVTVPDKVLERYAGDCAVAAIGLEHEHLVGLPGVDVAV